MWGIPRARVGLLIWTRLALIAGAALVALLGLLWIIPALSWGASYISAHDKLWKIEDGLTLRRVILSLALGVVGHDGSK